MGLDIFAASHLRYVRPIPRGNAYERLVEEFEAKGKDFHIVYFVVHPNDPYHRARLGGMKTGIYAYTTRSRKYGFRAGSYSGYNLWRDQLSRFALGVPAEDMWFEARRYQGKPFAELINFTDCDGRIGTSVAAKLAGDFTSHATRARRYATTLPADDPEAWAGEDWLAVYRDFARAFRLAAKNGALTFC